MNANNVGELQSLTLRLKAAKATAFAFALYTFMFGFSLGMILSGSEKSYLSWAACFMFGVAVFALGLGTARRFRVCLPDASK